MNAFDMARMAYAPQSAPMRSPQSIEFEAFARVTRNLRQADGTDRSRFAALAAAVHENRKLWGVLATCVADNSNALPPELRARIFYLYEFTDQHSAKVLRREAGTDILVEINTAVMRGLRSEGCPA